MEERPSARADLVSGAGWLVLGAAIVTGAWRMDRLESQGATLYSYPGLVPGILGAAIALMGVMLIVRSVIGGLEKRTSIGWNPRLTWAAALMLGYGLVLVGRVPFWLATWIFVSLFVAGFEWRARGTAGERRRGIAMALLYGAATALIVSFAFERLFLVRLP